MLWFYISQHSFKFLKYVLKGMSNKSTCAHILLMMKISKDHWLYDDQSSSYLKNPKECNSELDRQIATLTEKPV